MAWAGPAPITTTPIPFTGRHTPSVVTIRKNTSLIPVTPVLAAGERLCILVWNHMTSREIRPGFRKRKLGLIIWWNWDSLAKNENDSECRRSTSCLTCLSFPSDKIDGYSYRKKGLVRLSETWQESILFDFTGVSVFIRGGLRFNLTLTLPTETILALNREKAAVCIWQSAQVTFRTSILGCTRPSGLKQKFCSHCRKWPSHPIGVDIKSVQDDIEWIVLCEKRESGLRRWKDQC